MNLSPEEVETVRRMVRPSAPKEEAVPRAVVRRLLQDRLNLETSIGVAMDNIGVPGEGYPANIAVAYRTLAEALG